MTHKTTSIPHIFLECFHASPFSWAGLFWPAWGAAGLAQQRLVERPAAHNRRRRQPRHSKVPEMRVVVVLDDRASAGRADWTHRHVVGNRVRLHYSSGVYGPSRPPESNRPMEGQTAAAMTKSVAGVLPTNRSSQSPIRTHPFAAHHHRWSRPSHPFLLHGIARISRAHHLAIAHASHVDRELPRPVLGAVAITTSLAHLASPALLEIEPMGLAECHKVAPWI